jgi:hypothetical protein
MAEDAMHVMKALVGKEEFRVVETVMVEAMPKAEVEVDTPPAKGPRRCPQGQHDHAKSGDPCSDHDRSHDRSPSRSRLPSQRTSGSLSVGHLCSGKVPHFERAPEQTLKMRGLGCPDVMRSSITAMVSSIISLRRRFPPSARRHRRRFDRGVSSDASRSSHHSVMVWHADCSIEVRRRNHFRIIHADLSAGLCTARRPARLTGSAIREELIAPSQPENLSHRGRGPCQPREAARPTPQQAIRMMP